jgi:predicted RNA binding protein YcfA (HicA-like mRNA interferase family)
MNRLPMVTSKQVIQALQRAGFEPSYKRTSHVLLIHPIKTVATVVSIHPGDLKRGTLKKILKQVGLTEDEFRKLL